MSKTMFIITSLSLLGLLIISVYYFIRSKNIRRFFAHLFILAIGFAFIYFFFYVPQMPTGRGDSANDIYFVIVLYFFMLLGMLAQYIYSRLEQAAPQRKKFEWGLFVAPIFASPVVFIPLLSALQNADIDLKNLTTTKLMVFFVAFENGFFWKEYFDHRRQSISEGKDEK
ncbi:MAG: hypothetical protein ONB37_04620 [candidate division KSB1 bacterium]|nr:hypothetical protein [candidate division KSB1 bacterium]